MKPIRIFVEKLPGFRTECESLRRDLNSNLNLDIKEMRLICLYDLFGFTPELVKDTEYRVFAEPATDSVAYDIDLQGRPAIAVECLPGQFDQRAASAVDCVRLIAPDADVMIRSARLMIFDHTVSEDDLKKIESYCINPVESRRKDLSVLAAPESALPRPEETLTGFRDITADSAHAYCSQESLAMNADDLMEVVKYFTAEGRDPNRTELRILDTYWSDHCRHTTFMSELTDIAIDPSPYSADIEASLADWHRIRKELGRENKPLCLMDLACIGARYLRHTGVLDNLEESEENNACSIYVDLDVDGDTERWLLQFKNETHNHPTEIEPFGGASTCLGGAIRDPLSGRAYVYQAMRVTGAGNIYAPVADTMAGKLPQRVISLRAAAGYSSYGNQIGLATTHVREIYHPGYVAKRLEVGAVAGAVKASDVRRESPAPGDVILMLGGRTGRDGIGGATGSSKQHTASSLEECGSEVQKGNAPEERKIERLFRRPEATRLIKKSNDFGAGGVSVAIGELADGLEIYLDRVKTKYSGLSATDLAISESQERMAVVVEKKDMEEFMRLCGEENIEVTHVADVTDTGRMRMTMGKETIVDLSREFIDSAGARHTAQAQIGAPAAVNVFERRPQGSDIESRMLALLSDPNVTSQKGLVEMFDSSIGASTVLMPFGGKTQQTECQVSVQKFPVAPSNTDTASMMAYGFDPFLSEWSPYHGAAYAVVDAVAKAVAAGADFHRMRFSYQEYFERMSSPKAWGKPLAALLGALRMQVEMGLPSIGGKDSMSGTFADINVPPTLIAFGIAPVDARTVVSAEFKEAGHMVYLLKAPRLDSLMPDTKAIMTAYEDYHTRLINGEIKAAWAVGFGGVAEGLAKMTFGNRIGITADIAESDLFDINYGSIIIETDRKLPEEIYTLIGATIPEPLMTVNGREMPVEELYQACRGKFTEVYPDRSGKEGMAENATSGTCTTRWKGEKTMHPRVFLPVFPGTNCDYDMAASFAREGAETSFGVFRNLTGDDIKTSVEMMVEGIDSCHILALSGGFSSGDEPDGSGKFIASVLMNAEIKAAIERLLERGGLVIGICNGFQALIKSGLLPYGRIGSLDADSPTLFRNDINRHISQIVSTRVASVASPWLEGFTLGEIFNVAASHGEGKFMASPELAARLAEAGQIAFQYADASGQATMHSPENPNGSVMAIEGIISPCGKILGKMAHSERYSEGLMLNIPGNKDQNIFRNAVRYFSR